MPSVNLRELRNTRQLKAWLQAGQTIELRERNRRLARIVPETAVLGNTVWPDFAARAAKILKGQKLDGADMVITEREQQR